MSFSYTLGGLNSDLPGLREGDVRMPSLFSVDRRALTGSVFSLTLLALAGVAFAQGRTRSAIRDTAGMFGEEAVAKADRKLEEYREKYGVPTVIETVESLQGQPIEDVAPRHAK